MAFLSVVILGAPLQLPKRLRQPGVLLIKPSERA